VSVLFSGLDFEIRLSDPGIKNRAVSFIRVSLCQLCHVYDAVPIRVDAARVRRVPYSISERWSRPGARLPETTRASNCASNSLRSQGRASLNRDASPAEPAGKRRKN
jgi:hypothetical protein